MQLEKRKKLLVRLGEYMLKQDDVWTKTKEKAYQENRWFIPEFISLSVKNIALNFLQPEALENLINSYDLVNDNHHPKKVGIVMAGNIPLVGFHDFLCVFLTGHIAF